MERNNSVKKKHFKNFLKCTDADRLTFLFSQRKESFFGLILIFFSSKKKNIFLLINKRILFNLEKKLIFF